MPPFVERHLLPEALRLFAAAQAMPLVVVHAVWLLLLASEAGQGGALADVGKNLVRTFVWLGGVGPDGRGNEDTIFLAWTKVAVVVWLLDLLFRAVRGEPRPIALWKLSLASGAIAAAGMYLATRSHGLGGDLPFVLGFFALFGTGAAFWAIGARRLAEQVVRRLRKPVAAGGAGR